jgi:hypothetical protein
MGPALAFVGQQVLGEALRGFGPQEPVDFMAGWSARPRPKRKPALASGTALQTPVIASGTSAGDLAIWNNWAGAPVPVPAPVPAPAPAPTPAASAAKTAGAAAKTGPSLGKQMLSQAGSAMIQQAFQQPQGGDSSILLPVRQQRPRNLSSGGVYSYGGYQAQQSGSLMDDPILRAYWGG